MHRHRHRALLPHLTRVLRVGVNNRPVRLCLAGMFERERSMISTSASGQHFRPHSKPWRNRDRAAHDRATTGGGSRHLACRSRRPSRPRDPLAFSDASRKVEVMGAKPSRSGHLPINGLSLYHEVYGELGTSKPPLLLIPCAFMATDSMKSWMAAFAGKRTVIVFDQQGHGRTPDTSRKMSYEQFADDSPALLRALKVELAEVMG